MLQHVPAPGVRFGGFFFAVLPGWQNIPAGEDLLLLHYFYH